MEKFSSTEKKVIRELIKYPKVSDNQISKNTNIPVMTVNRTRKRLENEEKIAYMVKVNKGEKGTNIYRARQLYVIHMALGITAKAVLDVLRADYSILRELSEKVSYAFLGEREGHLALIMILDSETETELTEEFQGRFVPYLKKKFGKDAIRKILTTKISIPILVHNNYFPLFNIKNGKIKESWLDEMITI